MKVRFGDLIPLSRVLEDGNPSLYVQASLFDGDGLSMPGSPVEMEHVGDGLYLAVSGIQMPASLVIFSVYKVFDSPGYTTLASGYPFTKDVFQLDYDQVSEINGIIDDTSDLIGTVEETQCQ